ncbi:MAG: DNA polymerase III subunit gamma/tau [Leptospira sp.]|nr:DNA polymerase III subunit gamma/tau [Leptospira sp.]
MIENHLVLSRKYRPQIFKDVIYQDFAVNALQNALKSGRIGHAYIFFGPRGVGKTTIARILAKRLNCENPTENEPCNECTSCIEIMKGNSNDVLEIDAASHRGINHIRELRENVKFSPMGGKYKIYIIDEVHMLTPESFNALLKTLEEPPPHVVFILATTEFHKIPETILSRCQDFIFKKVPLLNLQSYAEHLCKLENIKYDDEGIFWLARKGDGSVRDCLSFMEQAMIFTDSVLTGELLRKMVGYTGINTHTTLLTQILNDSDYISAIKTIQKLFIDGEDLVKFVWDFLDFLNALTLVMENLGERENVNLPAEDIRRMQNEFSGINLETLNYLSEKIYSIYEKLLMLKLRSSFEVKTYLEIQMRKLAFDMNKPSLSGVLERINQLTQAVQGEINSIPKDSILKVGTVENDAHGKINDVESLIKEQFAGTEVDSSKMPDLGK